MLFQQRIVIRNSFDELENAHLDVKHPQAIQRIRISGNSAAEIFNYLMRILGIYLTRRLIPLRPGPQNVVAAEVSSC